MPFCDWCRLESESDDVCVWCKRPFTRNVAAYSGRYDSIALLREDSADSGDRATMIVGGVVAASFLAVVVYALVMFGGSTKTKSGDPLSQVAASELTWSGNRPPPPVAAPSPGPTFVAAPAAPAKPAASQTSTPRRQTESRPTAGSMSGAGVVPQGFAVRDGEVELKGLFIDHVNLSTARQSNGEYTVDGSIAVANVSGHRAYDLKFWLLVGDAKVPLKVKDGSDVGNGLTVRFSVLAKDVDATIARSAEASVYMTGTTDAGKVSDTLPVGG